MNQFSFTSDIVQAANTVPNEFRLLAFHSSRKLEEGDKVWVTIDFPFTEEAYLVDSVLHFTHFTGIMLEEEIIASLWMLLLLNRNAQNDNRLVAIDTQMNFFIVFLKGNGKKLIRF